MTTSEIIACLQDLADHEKVVFRQKKFGISAENSLGIYHSDLKLIAQEIGKDSQLALELFDTGIYEARLLCSKLFDPKDLTIELMEKWVKTFNNWEICDSFCMSIFARSPLAHTKITEWARRTPEFEKRASFATLAALCMADKKAENKLFEQYIPLIEREANDARLYVKKAVNWALRGIGKRNIDLHSKAVATAHRLLAKNTKSATWIAKNALAELEKDTVRIADYPRHIYRKSKSK